MKLRYFYKIIASVCYAAVLALGITACGENPKEPASNTSIVPAKLKSSTNNSGATISVSSEKWGEADGNEIRL